MDENRKSAPPNSPLPMNVTRESFYGFDITDDEVGRGEYSRLALEIKHIIEAMVDEADQKNEEISFTQDLDHALRRFVLDPSKSSLEHLLSVSPTFVGLTEELLALLKIC